MASELRETGISIIGDLPWGTHFCHFYETKQDLLDTLVPYFKTGLESKELCLWVVSDSELITVEEAKAALGQVVPDLERYLSEETIEILNGHDWYLENNVLNLERVMTAWDASLKQALARGYNGLRASADTFWLAEQDLKDFSHYERQVDDWIADQRMKVLCTYPLAKSGAAEILDVLHVHQFATVRRRGEWQVIQTPELIQAKAEINRLNEQLRRVKERTPKPPLILRYGVAVLSVIAALIIARFLNAYLVSAPAMLFLCALMFSAWYGGLKPSLLAMVLSLLAFKYYFLTPIHSLTVEARELPRLLIFSLLSGFVVSLSVAQRRSAESLRRARDVVDETVQQLKRTCETLRAEIAERKRTETLLHAREQEFRAIVENAPDQIIRYDRKLRRTYVNPAVAMAYGLPAEALIGKPSGSVIQDAGLDVKKDELALVRQRLASVFETGKSYEYEMTWPTSTGRKDFSVRLFPEIDLNGSVINVLGIARDITVRRIAEDELKREKETLEKIFDNIPVMIGFVGDDGAVKFVNPEWERTIGWTLKELREQNVDIFEEAYPDLPYRQEVLDFVAASTGEWVDLKIKVRDGRVIDAACAVIHLSDGTKVAIAQDITERKRAEESIRATTKQLRALSARIHSAKEEEGARIARELHDELGSTLTGMKWSLEELDGMLSAAGSTTNADRMRQKLATMSTVIDATIDTVRRISSELRPSILDDLGLVPAIRWQSQQFAKRAGITCNFSSSIETAHLSQEQSTAVFRIFQEALTNVARHAQATVVNVAIKEETGQFVLTIRDNGRGIKAHQKSGAEALGLLGMRERAHLVGGEVTIDASEGRGTLVTVRIPVGNSTVR